MSDDRCQLLCVDLPRAETLRASLLRADTAERSAARARALGDPTRLTLATLLRDGRELCVCDLAWIVGRAQNLVSHHMRILRREGLVRSRRDGKMVLYELTVAGEHGLDAVLDPERLTR